VTIEWTPKEQRSREKWRQHLANFQVKFGLSREEMDAEIAKQEAIKIADGDTSIINYNSSMNSADYILGYLLPNKKKEKMRSSCLAQN
jgi:hypothetical protein